MLKQPHRGKTSFINLLEKFLGKEDTSRPGVLLRRIPDIEQTRQIFCRGAGACRPGRR
jgi:hypothetical protein